MTAVAQRDAPGRHDVESPREDVAVELWLTSIQDRASAADVYSLLDDTERARSRRYRFERDRIRFVNRRAYLRQVLASYIQVEPSRIRLRTASHGRPQLADGGDLSFNLSHADGMVAVVVARGTRVGMDLERLRPIEDVGELARGLFHPREVAALLSAPSAQRSAAFLSIWTRKEAIVKADGRGLSVPLDRFDVLSRDGQGMGRPRDVDGDLPYVFSDLDLPDGLCGAVAVAKPGARLRITRRTLP